MNTATVETRAISFLNIELTNCEYLDPCLPQKDTKPLWDGYIIVHSSKIHKNENIIGRVNVQVKGISKKIVPNNELTFPIYISDLRVYLRDGGLIYFVVCMNEDDHSIFYTSLLPFDIVRLLKQKKVGNQISVKLKKFPIKNPPAVTRLFRSFLDDFKKQFSTVSTDILSIDDIETKIDRDQEFNVSIPVINGNLKDSLSGLIGEDIYVYIKHKGFESQTPVEKITLEVMEQHNIMPVSIDGRQFYNSYKIIESEKSKGILFGKSIFFDSKGGQYSFSLKGSIKERIIDLEFIVSLIETGHLDMGSQRFDVKVNEIGNNKFKFKNHLSYLNRVQQLLEKLNIRKELDLDSFSDVDYLKISQLLKTVIDKNYISLDFDYRNAFLLFIDISNLTIGFEWEQNDFGLFRLINYFEKSGPNLFSEINMPVSKYSILKSSEILKISNLDLNLITESIYNIGSNSLAYDYHNLFILELIKAYDSLIIKDQKYLIAAQNMFKFYIGNNELDRTRIKLNMLQIIKRIRNFNLNEIEELLEIKRINSDLEIQVGVNILLESFNETEYYFDKLDLNKQETFKNFPIYNLWKGPQTSYK